MNTAITVIQVVLVLLFTAGVFKLALLYAKFLTMPTQVWANDFKPEQVRLIGNLN
jgi:hypothetical protein